tara:strand:+ start:1044 stop:1505 length:462 start_codon:yes stop_codon:yes gene_type:complete
VLFGKRYFGKKYLTHPLPHPEKMTNLLKSLYDILKISTKIKKREELEKHIIIEAVNECGEKRYIQVKKPIDSERLENARILYRKSKKLISFLSRSSADDETFRMVLDLHEKIKNARYTNEDVDDLFDEFEEMKKNIKRMSISNMNLSSLEFVK